MVNHNSLLGKHKRFSMDQWGNLDGKKKHCENFFSMQSEKCSRRISFFRFCVACSNLSHQAVLFQGFLSFDRHSQLSFPLYPKRISWCFYFALWQCGEKTKHLPGLIGLLEPNGRALLWWGFDRRCVFCGRKLAEKVTETVPYEWASSSTNICRFFTWFPAQLVQVHQGAATDSSLINAWAFGVEIDFKLFISLKAAKCHISYLNKCVYCYLLTHLNISLLTCFVHCLQADQEHCAVAGETIRFYLPKIWTFEFVSPVWPSHVFLNQSRPRKALPYWNPFMSVFPLFQRCSTSAEKQMFQSHCTAERLWCWPKLITFCPDGCDSWKVIESKINHTRNWFQATSGASSVNNNWRFSLWSLCCVQI